MRRQVGQRQSLETKPISRGTDSSNPAPSSGESNELRTHPSTLARYPLPDLLTRNRRFESSSLQQRVCCEISLSEAHPLMTVGSFGDQTTRWSSGSSAARRRQFSACRKRIRRCRKRGMPFLRDQLGRTLKPARAVSGMEAARSRRRFFKACRWSSGSCNWLYSRMKYQRCCVKRFTFLSSTNGLPLSMGGLSCP